MSWVDEPEFLDREVIDAIHEHQIEAYGGPHGVRDENALESAIAAAQNVCHYAGGDVFEVTAAYAFHLAESKPILTVISELGSRQRWFSLKDMASILPACLSKKRMTQ
jgi:hypothetical protein